MKRTKTKTLTTAEAARVISEMPTWQKQRLAGVLIKIARNRGWLQASEQFVPPSAGEDGTKPPPGYSYNGVTGGGRS